MTMRKSRSPGPRWSLAAQSPAFTDVKGIQTPLAPFSFARG
jgi:hypothetical protein